MNAYNGESTIFKDFKFYKENGFEIMPPITTEVIFIRYHFKHNGRYIISNWFDKSFDDCLYWYKNAIILKTETRKEFYNETKTN